MILLAIVLFGVTTVLPIYLLITVLALKKRVKVLESGAVAPEQVRQSLPQETREAEDRKLATIPWPKPVEREATAPAGQVETTTSTKLHPPRNFVFTNGFGARISDWLQANWFYAVATVSFALAGVFLVQYGIEKGLLTPAMRVLAAMLLGVALIAAGEVVRRRYSDEDGDFQYLPSAFSGAGLVSLFAGILAARLMYDLVGPQIAFVGLAITAVAAIVLGWYYGPLLAIVGVFGALVTPFLIGGDPTAAGMLQFYFAIVAIVALLIDSVKRWAWLTSLGLIGAYSAATLLYLETGESLNFSAFALLTAAAAIILPERHLIPRHSGIMMSEVNTLPVEGKKGTHWPEFPTRVAVGAFLASTLIALLVYANRPGNFTESLLVLALLFIGAALWAKQAGALGDLPLIPLLPVIGVIMVEGIVNGPVKWNWLSAIMRPELDYPPATVAILLGGATLTGLVLAWRSWKGGAYPRFYAAVSAGFAPVVALVLALSWEPAHVLGRANWALYLAPLAIAMTVLAERFARKDGADRLRVSLFALSAISMVSFMLVVLLGNYALTVSLAVMVLAAAWLGRRFDLPLMDRYMQAGAIVIGWRLVLDPGLDWAFTAPFWPFAGTYLAVILLLYAAQKTQRDDAGSGVTGVMESAVWSLATVFIFAVVIRYFRNHGDEAIHLTYATEGLVWLVSAAIQFYRLKSGGVLTRLRAVLSGVYGTLGLLWLGVAVFPFSPLGADGGLVAGPFVFDTLLLAYGAPALLSGFVALKFEHLDRLLRRSLGFGSAALAALYVGLEIRRWWQGNDLSASGVLDGEQYSYTIAMLLLAVLLLILAYVRQSPFLRKLALITVGVTVVKVYLVDMSSLAGLLRALSFFVLAVVAAGLALLNRVLRRNEAVKTP